MKRSAFGTGWSCPCTSPLNTKHNPTHNTSAFDLAKRSDIAEFLHKIPRKIRHADCHWTGVAPGDAIGKLEYYRKGVGKQKQQNANLNQFFYQGNKVCLTLIRLKPGLSRSKAL